MRNASHAIRRLSVCLSVIFSVIPAIGMHSAFAQDQSAELTAEQVLRSIERGRNYLLGQQRRDGSWPPYSARYPVGGEALITLALLNSGMTARDPEISRALAHLRKHADDAKMVYEVSLLASVFAAARDGEKDQVRLGLLARKLEDSQIRRGEGTGGWGYEVTEVNARWNDRSNSQFALLGLRDAALAGAPVSPKVWERARGYWKQSQQADGGWTYTGGGGGTTGSMTVAGIASLTIIESMLRDTDAEITADGKPICCIDEEPDPSIARGLRWLERHFDVRANPGGARNWGLYYLYGLERAGRLTGRRFFGQHDWYRRGAEFLLAVQSPAHGGWAGEEGALVDTSFALLFLSKGLSPVLISKLRYSARAGDRAENAWNPQPNDVRNLTSHIAALPEWPHLMSTQVVDFSKLTEATGAEVLLQSKILYISGAATPIVTDGQVRILREYLDAGGYILAAATCREQAAEFDKGFRRLVQRIYEEEAELRLLPATHVVYRSEYPLNDGDTTVGLWGVDFGCRTPILYVPPTAPLDLACLWNKWMHEDPPERDARMKTMIRKAMWVGVNIVAYATGREPPVKLQEPRTEGKDEKDPIERGLLQVARVRHGGGWDTAPRALKNLLRALNEAVGLSASTKSNSVGLADPDLYKYPVVYMHGRNSFELTAGERDQLKKYARRGGVLFADACCGARPFDESFREEIEATFGRKFERIPPAHELFTEKVGYDLRKVKRRSAAAANPDEPIDTKVREVEPFLEGIAIDGRYAVIYSKYDISCALEHQASSACPGYESEDAFRIAINVILYAMLQDVGGEK